MQYYHKIVNFTNRKYSKIVKNFGNPRFVCYNKPKRGQNEKEFWKRNFYVPYAGAYNCNL